MKAREMASEIQKLAEQEDLPVVVTTLDPNVTAETVKTVRIGWFDLMNPREVVFCKEGDLPAVKAPGKWEKVVVISVYGY